MGRKGWNGMGKRIDTRRQKVAIVKRTEFSCTWLGSTRLDSAMIVIVVVVIGLRPQDSRLELSCKRGLFLLDSMMIRQQSRNRA